MESSYGEHKVVFKEGSKAEKLFLVKQGQVLCLKASKDRLIPVFMAKSGDIIGESAMIKDLDYTYSAISMDSVQLIEIPAANFESVFSKSPDWIENLMTTMISRFQNTSNLIAENRIVSPEIISEEEFTPQAEIEFKKLLS